MSSIIELPPRRSVGTGVALFGLVLVAGSAASWSVASSRAVPGFLLGTGAVLVVFGLRRLVTRTPSLRATEGGVWFGGGSVIPWTEIKQVFTVDNTVQTRFASTRTNAVSFELHRRRTLFRAPIMCWLAAPFAVGDIDIGSTENSSVLASRLEGMRVQAVGTEDGAVRGATDLPAARLVQRKD